MLKRMFVQLFAVAVAAKGNFGVGSQNAFHVPPYPFTKTLSRQKHVSSPTFFHFLQTSGSGHLPHNCIN